MELSSQASLQQLAETLQMPDKGDSSRRQQPNDPSGTKWSETILQENDQVVVIKSCLWWISLFIENNQSYIH